MAEPAVAHAGPSAAAEPIELAAPTAFASVAVTWPAPAVEQLELVGLRKLQLVLLQAVQGIQLQVSEVQVAVVVEVLQAVPAVVEAGPVERRDLAMFAVAPRLPVVALDQPCW